MRNLKLVYVHPCCSCALVIVTSLEITPHRVQFKSWKPFLLPSVNTYTQLSIFIPNVICKPGSSDTLVTCWHSEDKAAILNSRHPLIVVAALSFAEEISRGMTLELAMGFWGDHFES